MSPEEYVVRLAHDHVLQHLQGVFEPDFNLPLRDYKMHYYSLIVIFELVLQELIHFKGNRLLTFEDKHAVLVLRVDFCIEFE